MRIVGGESRTSTSAPPAGLSVEQWENAKTIAQVGRQLGVGARGIQIALMTALVESGLRDVSYGNRDSVGIFQQRSAWGSYEKRMNVAQSARMFFTGGEQGQRGLLDIHGWDQMDPGAAAQAVQVSANPTAYGRQLGKSQQILEKLGDTGVPVTVPTGTYNGTSGDTQYNPPSAPTPERMPVVGAPSGVSTVGGFKVPNVQRPVYTGVPGGDPSGISQENPSLESPLTSAYAKLVEQTPQAATPGNATGAGEATALGIQPSNEGQDLSQFSSSDPALDLTNLFNPTTVDQATYEHLTKNTAPDAKVGGIRAAMLNYARSALGTPYVFGGNSPSQGLDCVRAGSIVSTPAGPVRVEDVQVGSLVYGWLDGEMVARPVEKVIPKGVRPALKVRTRNRALWCTDGHELPVLRKHAGHNTRGGKSKNSWTVEWVRTDSVNRGDLVVIQRQQPDNGSTPITAEEAWFLGLWTGDGHLSDNRHLFTCVYDGLADRVERFAKDRFGANCTRHPSLGIGINSVEAVKWITGLGVVSGSHKKIVPEVIKTAGWKVQQAFCDGYLDADGSVDKRGWLTYNSCNLNLLSQVRSILIGLSWEVSNINCNPRRKTIVIKGKTVKNASPLYGFQVYPNVKVGNQTELNGFGAHRAFNDANFTCERVLSVEPDGSAEMWDLTVHEASTFIADGMLVHNCSGLVKWALNQAGVHGVPRLSHLQAAWSGDLNPKANDLSGARPGDLLTWGDGYGGAITDHIAIYVGNDQILEEPRPGESARIIKLGSYYRNLYGGFHVAKMGKIYGD